VGEDSEVLIGHTATISRHRLPAPYRAVLTALWLTPIALLAGTLVFARGFSPALLDFRLAITFGLMALPALYVWREGIDVLHDGLRVRVAVTRRYPYDGLGGWQLADRPARVVEAGGHIERDRVLTIWDQHGQTALQVHAAHLTELPSLIAALGENVRRADG
jgi:hypothetical protein